MSECACPNYAYQHLFPSRHLFPLDSPVQHHVEQASACEACVQPRCIATTSAREGEKRKHEKGCGPAAPKHCFAILPPCNPFDLYTQEVV